MRKILKEVLVEFDYSHAAQLWGMAFTSVVGLYLLGHVIGLILNLIRTG